MNQPFVDLDPVVTRFPLLRKVFSCIAGTWINAAYTKSSTKAENANLLSALAMAAGVFCLVYAVTWWVEQRIIVTFGATLVVLPLAYLWFWKSGPAGAPARLLATMFTGTLVYVVGTTDFALSFVRFIVSKFSYLNGLADSIPVSGQVPLGALLLLLVLNRLTFLYWFFARASHSK